MCSVVLPVLSDVVFLGVPLWYGVRLWVLRAVWRLPCRMPLGFPLLLLLWPVYGVNGPGVGWGFKAMAWDLGWFLGEVVAEDRRDVV